MRMPARLAQRLDAQTVLASHCAAFARVLKPLRLRQRPIRLCGYPGRELAFETPAGLLYRTRAYLVKGRLYQLFVAAPRIRADPKQFTRYLDSFALLGTR